MKVVKKLISVAFLVGLLAFVGALYFASTNHILLPQLLVIAGLVLVTAALIAALAISTQEIQRVKVEPGVPESKGSTAGAVLEVLLSAFMYR